MNSQADVIVDARLDRSLIWTGGDSVRYLVVRVVGRARDSDTGARRPHNLALAIDRSDGLGPAGLAAGKAIASAIIRRLSAEDHLAVLAFDSQTRVVAPSSPMDDEAKRQTLAALETLGTGQGLDLADGWLAAAEEVATQMTEGDAHNRVILLSGGRVSHRIVVPEELAREAAALRVRGIFTTAIGIAAHGNVAPLAAIDDHRGHRVQVARSAQEIAEAVIAGSLELSPVVADDLTITVRCREARIEALNPPVAHVAVAGKVRLDGLRAGEVVNLVYRLIFPRGAAGETAAVSVGASWCHPTSGDDLTAPPIALEVRFAEGRENTPQARDEAASTLAALAWQARIIGRVIDFALERRHGEAETYLARELLHFQRYCEGLSQGATLRHSLRQALDSAHRPWRARALRERPPIRAP